MMPLLMTVTQALPAIRMKLPVILIIMRACYCAGLSSPAPTASWSNKDGGKCTSQAGREKSESLSMLEGDCPMPLSARHYAEGSCCNALCMLQCVEPAQYPFFCGCAVISLTAQALSPSP